MQDAFVRDIIVERLEMSDCEKGAVLCGFPRNYKQARMFEQWLAMQDEDITGAIVVQCPEELVGLRYGRRRRKCVIVASLSGGGSRMS